MRIADEAEARFARKVAWGARCGTEEELFTTLSVPVMTRLRLPERQVLDTLVDAGVARSRSHALAWCVRLVGDHEGEWIDQLREALVHVEKVRGEGPGARSVGRRPRDHSTTNDECAYDECPMEIPLGRQLFLTHRATHDELDRRLHEHGASLWNWVLLAKRPTPRAPANVSWPTSCGSSRRRSSASSTSWRRKDWSSDDPIRPIGG